FHPARRSPLTITTPVSAPTSFYGPAMAPPLHSFPTRRSSDLGWTCTITNVTCTRSDALAAGSSYPAITVIVSVATNAPSSVTNTSRESTSGLQTLTTANCSVTVNTPPTPVLKITKTHTGNFTH